MMKLVIICLCIIATLTLITCECPRKSLYILIQSTYITHGIFKYFQFDLFVAECLEKIDSGMCKAAHPKFGYDKEKKECKSFNYGGCGGNKNNFSKKEDCDTKCGPCKA